MREEEQAGSDVSKFLKGMPDWSKEFKPMVERSTGVAEFLNVELGDAYAEDPADRDVEMEACDKD